MKKRSLNESKNNRKFRASEKFVWKCIQKWKKSFYYENMKFFIIFKKLSQHMILVNISQQKVNTRSTHGQYHPTYQNVQNFIKKMNLVNIWFFGQQKVNITQHIKIFVYILPLTYGGWAGKLKYQVFSKDFIKIKIISLVNRRSTSPSIPKVLSTFYFSSMVGGWAN